MLRSSLTLAGLVAFGATAQAQQTLPANRVHSVVGSPRDAGIYHVATGTWTRKANQADIGADIIYNNTWPFTAGTTNFGGLSGDHFIDEGRIPSPNSPSNLSSRPGCAASYQVDGVQFGYCTDQANGGQYTLNFYQSYTTCATVPGAPTGTVAVNGPGNSVAFPIACWVLTIDLDPANDFAMLADGDGSFNTVAADRFGWEMFSPLPQASAVTTGPILAGDPSVSLQYDGTRWDSPVNYLEDGTGMSSENLFRIEQGPATPGCYLFTGGVPFASFHLELYADACSQPATGTPFCFGDGLGTACPCGQSGAAGNGCGSSVSVAGANLTATGTPSVSADTVVLTATLTPNASALFFQGTNQLNGGLGSVFGDGIRCAGGTVIRLGTKLPAGGVSSYPVGADPLISVRGMLPGTGGTRTYQTWYRNAAAFCTASTFNLTNGY